MPFILLLGSKKIHPSTERLKLFLCQSVHTNIHKTNTMYSETYLQVLEPQFQLSLQSDVTLGKKKKTRIQVMCAGNDVTKK